MDLQQQGAAARAEQQGSQRGEQQAGPARRKVASAGRLQARPLEAGRQAGRQADRQTGAGPGRLAAAALSRGARPAGIIKPNSLLTGRPAEM